MTGVVIQARNSSSRYPKKMMHNFLGLTAIEWVLNRCKNIKSEYKIVATSTHAEDDTIAKIAKKKSWKVIRGSVEDVLSRYEKAVLKFNLGTVVRVTGDCTLLDFNVVNYALTKFQEGCPDYLYVDNIIDGFNFEVVSGPAIIDAAKNARLPSEREHVCPYIRNNDSFKKTFIKYGEKNLLNIHLSLDYKEDAEVIEAILKRMDCADFSYEDVVNLINREPGILERNKHIKPHEGYLKSLEEDNTFFSVNK